MKTAILVMVALLALGTPARASFDSQMTVCALVNPVVMAVVIPVSLGVQLAKLPLKLMKRKKPGA